MSEATPVNRLAHPFPVHARVWHSGQRWGVEDRGTAELLEVRPMRDGTFEYRVKVDADVSWPTTGPDRETWWPSYRTNRALDDLFREPTPEVPPQALPAVAYPDRRGRLMCACADDDANWRGRGLTARYVCTCGGTTTSAKGLRWAPVTTAARVEEDADGEA